MSFVSYFTHCSLFLTIGHVMIDSIVREGNGSFRVIIDVEPVTIQFLLHLNIPLCLAFEPAKKRAAVLPILQQPIPSMDNLIVY